MGASLEQLEAEIEQTREDLAGTLDAIGHKVDSMKQSVTPKALVRRRGVQVAIGLVAALIGFKVIRRVRSRRN